MTCCSLYLKLGCMRSHDRQIYLKKCCCIYLFLLQSPKDGKLLRLEWGMILQVSSITFQDENSCVRCEYSKESLKLWCITYFRKFFEFLVRPCVVVGKYLEIFHLGRVSLLLLLRTIWQMSLTFEFFPKNNLISISQIVDGERRVCHVSRS